MKNTTFYILLISTLFLGVACNKDNEDYITESDLGMISQGKITVQLSGQTESGQFINENFTVTKHNNDYYYNSVHQSNYDGSYNINIARFEPMGLNKSVYLEIWSNYSMTESDIVVSIDYEKQLDENNLLDISLFDWGTNVTLDYTYNPTTHEITGQASFYEDWSENNNYILNVEVEFEAQLVKVLM